MEHYGETKDGEIFEKERMHPDDDSRTKYTLQQFEDFCGMNKEGAKKLWSEAAEMKPAAEVKPPWNRLLVATPKARPLRTNATKDGRLVKLAELKHD